MRANRWVAAAVLALLALVVARQAPRPALAATITFTPGWHLVAGPTGTVFRGLAALYTLDAASGQYASLPLDQPTLAGAGYFAYFTDLFVVRMAPDVHDAVTVPLAPGAWTMVGNPSAYSVAVVSGVDIAYVYDQQGGYLIESSVPPGAGALVHSATGGAATVRPIPGGIDATVSDLTDKLVDVALGPNDVPAGFYLTRADTNGGQNANIPASYIEEFRPRVSPKPSDSQQTVFIQVNIQETKDTDYANTLFDGLTTATVRDTFGQNVKEVEAVSAPHVGDAAKAFHVRVVNGTNQIGHEVLVFRRKQFVVIVVVSAPYGREDLRLLQALATTQDSRINAAF